MLDPDTVITPRQLELIALYASGYQLSEIAEMKFLSYSSVKLTLKEARTRVGAKSLAQLCALLLDHGLIVRDGDKHFRPVQAERVVGE